MSSNQLELGRSIEQEVLSRRRFTRGVAGLGVIATGLVAGHATYPAIKEVYDKYKSIGNDYGNGPFLEAVGARYPDSARVNELLSDAADMMIIPEKLDFDEREHPERIASFAFLLDKAGPVHVSFEGLEGDEVSQVMLQLVVDESEPFYVPVIRGPNKEAPAQIQLGMLDEREHRLDISLASGGNVSPDEIIPRFTQGEPNTIRSFIDRHQPDIYLRNYENITHNAPLRSLVFVYETDEDLALVYWTECIAEDLEYGRFGTPVEQLIETKNRPTDFDWVLEGIVSKDDGSLKQANIATPYHNRKKYPIDDSYVSHPRVRIDSANNNVVALRGESLSSSPRFRPRPEIYAHDDRWDVLYDTGRDAATLSMLEHNRRGNLNLNNLHIREYLGTLGLSAANLRN